MYRGFMFSASSFVLEFKVYIQGFGNVFLWPTFLSAFCKFRKAFVHAGFEAAKNMSDIF